MPANLADGCANQLGNRRNFLQVICRGQAPGFDLCCHISSCMPALSSQMLSKEVEGASAWFPKTTGGEGEGDDKEWVPMVEGCRDWSLHVLGFGRMASTTQKIRTRLCVVMPLAQLYGGRGDNGISKDDGVFFLIRGVEGRELSIYR